MDADASGWDVNQVLRPPGSHNYKRNDYTASLSVSSPYLINSSAFNTLPLPPKIDVEFGANDLLDNALVIAQYQWDKSTFNLFRTREISQGGRSTALMHIAYACCEMGMNDQEIITILYSADERWGKFRGRKDRMHRLNEMVAFARIKHPYSNLLQVREIPVFQYQDFMDTEVKIEWVIEGMLEQTGQIILSSKPGIGKTQLSLRFFMALATGQRILHYDILGTKRVIFFSLEMGHAQLKYFLTQMEPSLDREQRALLHENFLIVPLGEALYLGNRNSQGLVEDILSKYEVDGYAFDSLGRTTPASTSDEEQIKAILDWDARVRNQTNTFSWYVHHNRKSTIGNKKPKSLDDLIGSTVIQANTSSVYTMWRQEEDSFSPIEIINVKQRLGVMEAPYLITRGPNLTFTESKMKAPAVDEKIVQALGLPSMPGDEVETLPTPTNTGIDF